MKGNYKYSTGQLLNFARDSYFERTSRPVYAIVFLLPFIVFYELGTIFINTDVLNQSQVRVVAFVWLQNFLEYLGFSSRFGWMMPPLAVLIILAGLQVASRKRWSFGIGDIGPMAVECVLLAVPLIVLSLFLNTSVLPEAETAWFNNNMTGAIGLSASAGAGSDATASNSLLANIVTGIGAGIYEELVFRLILICLLMMLFQDVLRLSRRNSIILAVVISAALFSVHHHIVYLDGRFGQSGPINWMEFSFRAAAGVYFAVLFSIRGFGVTAGTHAFYDIIATVINSVFFQQ